MAIKNPEKECKVTPEKFSAESKIVSLEKKDNFNGVVLDTPEEFGQALIVYGSGSVEGSRTTQREFIEGIGESAGAMGIGAVLLFGARSDPDGFTKRLAERAISELKSSGSFHENFDYTFNNFQQTAVLGKRVGDKYVLRLQVAYAGSKPEENLAKTLGKPMALNSSCLVGKLSIVDDWWFNVNLEEVLANLPLPKETIASYLASKAGDRSPKPILFKHEGQEYSLGIGLNARTYLRPNGGDFNSNYMQSRGKFIVGGAWTTYAEDGNTKIPPRADRPSAIVSVSLPGESYIRDIAVTEEQMNRVRSVRDHLATFIQPK